MLNRLKKWILFGVLIVMTAMTDMLNFQLAERSDNLPSALNVGVSVLFVLVWFAVSFLFGKYKSKKYLWISSIYWVAFFGISLAVLFQTPQENTVLSIFVLASFLTVGFPLSGIHTLLFSLFEGMPRESAWVATLIILLLGMIMVNSLFFRLGNMFHKRKRHSHKDE